MAGRMESRSSNPMSGLYGEPSSKPRSSRLTSSSSGRSGYAPSEAPSYRSRGAASSVGSNLDRPSSGGRGGGSENVTLKKRVGLVSGTALIVGTMIGSGIFISPKGVTEGSGSVGLSLISWLICGVVSMLAGISYAELGTLIPKSGGEYSYLRDSFGPLQRFIGPLPAFLFNWVNTFLLKPAAMAIISLAFSIYIIGPVFDTCAVPQSAVKCLAALCILVLLLINIFSVRVATWVQNAFTVTKLVAVAIIVIAGLVKLGQGHTRYLASGFAGTETNVAKVTIGLYKGMWAYDGWNNLNYVTEELVNPYVNLPRAIMIGIPLVTVCYLMVNVSYFTMMSVQELLESPAVAVTWGNRVLGPAGWIIPLLVACSCFGAANGTLFSSGRLSYTAAREGHMIELLSMIHVKRYTPLPSLVFTSLLALIMIIPGNIESLIDFFNFAVWMFYGLTMVALIVMRYHTHKDVVRPYKVPIVFPIIVLIASIWLVVAPIVDQPRLEFLYAFLFIIGGLIFYVPFIYYEIRVPCLEPVSGFLQLLMEVSPPIDQEDDH